MRFIILLLSLVGLVIVSTAICKLGNFLDGKISRALIGIDIVSVNSPSRGSGDHTRPTICQPFRRRLSFHMKRYGQHARACLGQ